MKGKAVRKETRSGRNLADWMEPLRDSNWVKMMARLKATLTASRLASKLVWKLVKGKAALKDTR